MISRVLPTRQYPKSWLMAFKYLAINNITKMKNHKLRISTSLQHHKSLHSPAKHWTTLLYWWCDGPQNQNSFFSFELKKPTFTIHKTGKLTALYLHRIYIILYVILILRLSLFQTLHHPQLTKLIKETFNNMYK